MKTADDFYTAFKNVHSPEEKQELVKEIEAQGYALMNEWIKRLDIDLQLADEGHLDQIGKELLTAQELWPNPEKFSPLWDNKWEDLLSILAIKKQVYQEVPASEREGEWQILFDNPFSTEGTVIHVKLSFPTAAYQYAKYRHGLHKHEYVTIQKAHRYITEYGEQNSALGD